MVGRRKEWKRPWEAIKSKMNPKKSNQLNGPEHPSHEMDGMTPTELCFSIPRKAKLAHPKHEVLSPGPLPLFPLMLFLSHIFHTTQTPPSRAQGPGFKLGREWTPGLIQPKQPPHTDKVPAGAPVFSPSPMSLLQVLGSIYLDTVSSYSRLASLLLNF